MTMQNKLMVLLTALSVLSSTRPAGAEPTLSPLVASPAPRRDGSWGWLVLGSGVALGSAVTAYGLTFDCGSMNLGCERRASITIWGGVGIAALSSAVGIAIVQAGEHQLQVVPFGFRGSF